MAGPRGWLRGPPGALLLVHPVLSVLLGMLVLGERPTVWQAVGCALVVVTVAWVARPPGRGPHSSMRSAPV